MAESRRPTPPPSPPSQRPATVEASVDLPPRERSRSPRTIRFSVRELLIVVTVVAIASAAIGLLGPVAPFAAVLVGGALVSAMPICFGTLALYTRGMRQTFFLGAFVGSLSPLLRGSGVSLRISELLLLLIINFATALGCGYLAVVTRRSAVRRGWHIPPKSGRSDPRE